MERKVSSSTVTASEVKRALGKTGTLTSEEEKALRMRHGAGVEELKAPLPRAAGSNAQLADELLIIEMQLMKAMRARAATQAVSRVKPATLATNRTKDKIVRALRKKK